MKQQRANSQQDCYGQNIADCVIHLEEEAWGSNFTDFFAFSCNFPFHHFT
jgi:hypothetical protein